MKITHANQTIEFFTDPSLPSIPKHIALSISGGLDSASLLFLICKHYPQIKVSPIIGIDAYAKFDALCAFDIIECMKDRFPNHNILDNQSFTFDHRDPYWMEKANDLHNKDMATALAPEGTSKNIQMSEAIARIRAEIKYEWIVMGTTANPPDDYMKKHGFYDKAEHVRNEPHNRKTFVGNLYTPYINVNKRFVAGVYKENDLMDELYPYTSSCVGSPKQTEYGTVACGTCFWCHERKWGFEDD
jgi:7-cyano-7-deazaguanine synthase in queuosine biosynthesis